MALAEKRGGGRKPRTNRWCLPALARRRKRAPTSLHPGEYPSRPLLSDEYFKISKWSLSLKSLGAFQRAASVLGPGAGESVHKPF